MVKFLRLTAFLVLTFAFVVTGLPGRTDTAPYVSVGVAPAAAQAKKKRRSLFSVLFGKRRAKKRSVKKRRTTRRKTRTTRKKSRKRRTAKRSSRSRNTNAAGAAATAPVVVKKVDDAKVVLVVGDFFAGGLADGLEDALESITNIRVVDKSNGLSGFVRTDIVDWPEKLPALIDEIKPAYVVAMLGSNDRQLMRHEGKRLKKRTPEWDAAYQTRVNALAASLKSKNVPFTWVGLPPVRFTSMNKDLLVFNEWYRQAATSVGGKFVDVWDGFSDDNGKFTRSGPNVQGQIVLLRAKDGINLTRAGRRRLGFYVEAEVRRVLGAKSGILATVNEQSSPTLATPSYDPSKTGKTVVISLDDPAYDGSDTLAGENLNLDSQLRASRAVPLPVSVRKAPLGRADNFTWPPVQPSGSSPQAIATN